MQTIALLFFPGEEIPRFPSPSVRNRTIKCIFRPFVQLSSVVNPFSHTQPYSRFSFYSPFASCKDADLVPPIGMFPICPPNRPESPLCVHLFFFHPCARSPFAKINFSFFCCILLSFPPFALFFSALGSRGGGVHQSKISGTSGNSLDACLPLPRCRCTKRDLDFSLLFLSYYSVCGRAGARSPGLKQIDFDLMLNSLPFLE